MASTSPSIEHPSTAHKRTYQACIPCRRRKVRCDLGPVDAPHDPPCVRCRREKKDCFFTETRRKRKAEDEGAGELSEDYVVRNRRSRVDRPEVRDHGISGPHDAGSGSQDYDPYNGQPDSEERDEGNFAQRNPIPLSIYERPETWETSARIGETTPEGREVTNETAATLFKSPIHNPGDALHLLVDAVARSGDLDRQNQQTHPHLFTKENSHSDTGGFRGTVSDNNTPLAIDPAIANPVSADEESGSGLKDALRAWSRFRFVRAGWMTAREAVSYIDYFYEHLAPLTPISPPDFSSPSSHHRLLSEEPVLALTLLTTASRYMKLKGPAGQSRSFMVHDKLWVYLQSMITRMFWGQEQSGGGFCGAGATKEQRSAAPRGGLRSLGTVESLLLLSDWHPRSMHFPPGDDGDEIVVPLMSESEDKELYMSVSSSRTYAGWTEPALRSDKMCWSLVTFAYTLSYELGIFDFLTNEGQWRPLPLLGNGFDSERANRIGRLLHIYVNQTCGRLGISNILRHDGEMMDKDYFRMTLPPDRFPSMSDRDETIERIQRAWAGITALMRHTNAEMFETKAMTREIIQKGEYLDFLRDYWHKLRDWLHIFEQMDGVPPFSRTLLMIEYEYARTYINSLSLQAVLEQCATSSDEGEMPGPGGSAAYIGRTPPALLSSKLVDLRKQNAVYIAEVVDASRSMLRHVIEGLVPQDGLRHAPVRTHFRILSGAMFLLKAFALGAKKEEVDISLRILEDTVKCLRRNLVDDVHLIARIADLLHGLTSSIRTKFVRLAVSGRTSSKRTTNHQRKPSPQSSGIIAQPASPSVKRRAAFASPSGHGKETIADLSRMQGPLAGIATNLVDPNDSSVTIMPPPDYIYSSGYPAGETSSIYNHPIPPQQPYTNDQPLHQPQYQQQQQQQAFMYPPSSQDYDWLTLDVNPLIQQGQQSANNANQIGAGAWQGAFGPEIGESLEMLGMLANDGYGFTGGEGEITGWS